MSKTPTQEKLEAQRGKDIAEIVRDALEERRGQKHMVTFTAMDLGVTDAALYQWCREVRVDIDEYRRPAVGNGGGECRPHSSLRSGHLRGAASSLLDPVSHHERASLTWGGAEADVVPER